MTNFERIKAMSVVEMAEYVDGEYARHPFCDPRKDCTGYECTDCIAEWLESEVQDEAD